MWKYIMKYKYQNLCVVLMSIVGVGIVTTLSWLSGPMVDSAVDGNVEELIKWILINCLFVFTNVMVNRFRNIVRARAIASMNREMRRDISRKIEARSFQEFAGQDTGEYISWYTNDIREAENKGFMNFYNYIIQIFTVIAGAVVLFVMQWQLLVLTVILSVMNLYVSKHFEKKIEGFAARISPAMEKFTNIAKQQIAGFAMLKSFAHLGKFDQDMHEAGKELEEERYRFVKSREKVNVRMEGFYQITSQGLFTIVYALCALGRISAGTIMASLQLMYQVMGGISAIVQLRFAMAASKPFFDKISGEDIEKADREKLRRTEKLPMITNDIKVQNLEFAYTDAPIFQGLNLDFKIGGKYVIVGKSGCGKSTLLKLLLGQLTEYSGRILFDNKEAGNYNTDSFYNQMAYIEQKVFLFNTTIRENITMGDTFTEQEMQDALKKSALLQDMDHFPEGLDTKVGENGSSLSGGQKQRVAIARALIHKRSILIVDEGTSALDQENAAAIEDALLGCEDLTLILVSHHLREEKRKYYTDVYRLENGRKAA